ncbi:MAG: dependent oxidoreductase [Naasia sp.]|jgi:flavin-dependent dehydrogenase|uniref:NAD(P)/FAD-dependent oxidoreductase n=1 Tax=Naasia sp. TaxID=2546198 RepID=UPI00262DA11D|nr:FAD-dependent monooxygenase [Naasia sp.]MCU1571067.1 dependent oxidoreductase [Naasia sp.]
MQEADLLVVGGGPVGLVAAIQARLAGLDVVVAEPRTGPIDKACGEGLMPGAVAALAALGVHPEGRAIRGFRYTDGRRSVEHRLRHGAGLGVRRTTLHAALAARAAELGVVTVTRKATTVLQTSGAVEAAEVRASWLLACDGLHSPVRRTVGLDGSRRPGRRFGLRRHFRLEPWTDLVEVHWGRSVELYVTPVGPGLVGVAVLGPRHTGFDAALAQIPELEARLIGAQPDGPVRGAGPLRQSSRARSVGRVLLVGDASGYVDALTGEGMRVGFAQADAAVAAVIAGDPAAYEREWSARTRDFRALTGALVAAASSPLRRAIVPTAVAVPGLYGSLIERLAR